jgi:hypothetical protein
MPRARLSRGYRLFTRSNANVRCGSQAALTDDTADVRYPLGSCRRWASLPLPLCAKTGRRSSRAVAPSDAGGGTVHRIRHGSQYFALDY